MGMERLAHKICVNDFKVTVLVQKRRNKSAALKLLRKLIKNQQCVPDEIVTDGLASYKAALKVLGCRGRHRPGRLQDKTGLRTRIFRSDDESARCNASSPRDRHSASFPPTPQFTTPSPSSVTSSPARPCVLSERQPLPSGELRPRQVPEILWVGLSSRGES